MSQTVGVTTTHYVLDPAAGLTQVLADGTNTYLYGNARIGQYQASMQYFGADALGSVRQIYDASAQVIGSARYDPYGNVLAQSGATSVFAFAGEQYDAAGLEYLRARYYSVAQGRFLTRDVWEGDPNAPMSYNAWNYTNGNPANLTDPSGHYPYWCDDLPERKRQKCRDEYYGNNGITYNRQAAVDYAVQWMCTKNPDYAEMDPGCTNFVSQALLAGGLPQSSAWHGPSWPTWVPKWNACGSGINSCPLAWSYTPALRSYLIDALGFRHFSIDRVERSNPEREMQLPQEVRVWITRGDVVFYRPIDKDFEHAALVAGWGRPTYYRWEEDLKIGKAPGCPNPDLWSEGPQGKDLPWIIDHAGAGFSRAFDDIRDTSEVDFVHIPDQVPMPGQ